MKPPVSPRTVALLIFGVMAPLSAQNPAATPPPSACAREESGAVQRVKGGTRGVIYQVNANSYGDGLARMSALYRESGKAKSKPDCQALSLSVERQIGLDNSKVLEITEREVSANPACACEIVKAAIKASEADSPEVVAIVETAIHASPESMRIVSQCAIAASPDSVSGVQALLAKLDPNAGDAGHGSKGSKSAKGAKVASIIADPLPDPLDRP